MNDASYIFNLSETMTKNVRESLLIQQIESSTINKNLITVIKNQDDFAVVFDYPLTVAEEQTLSNIVSTHEHITTAESLDQYLKTLVLPFIENLTRNFAAQNIAMGITQAGKTGYVLGLFEMPVEVNTGFPTSLKASFDTGSLYQSIEIIEAHRQALPNYQQSVDLSPFVTDARLLELKNKIEAFLGIPITS